MRSIIRLGFRDRRWSMFSWTLGIGAFIAINILVYESISGQAQSLNKALENLPPAAQALFGSAGDFLSPVGYLNSKLYYLFLPLMFTMLGIGLARQLFRSEEDSGTMELLLGRPVSRFKLLASKLVTSLAVMLVVTTNALLITIACCAAIDYQVGVWQLMQANTMALLISLLFSSVAWFFFALGRFGKRASVGLAGSIALGSYLITSLAGLADWLEWPSRLLPFHYYQPAGILLGEFSWRNAVGMLIAWSAIIIASFVVFRRRDLS